MSLTMRLEDLVDADALLGAGEHRVRGVEADDLLDLLADALGIGRRQVDLVEHRDDLEVVVERQVDVGQGLRLDALGGVDHQDRPLAGGEAARHLVREVDVARGVDQVQDVVLAVAGAVRQAHGAGLDGDAALALEVHVVENLVLHLARRDRARPLQQPVGQRGLAVVDVGDDGEVADAVAVHRKGSVLADHAAARPPRAPAGYAPALASFSRKKATVLPMPVGQADLGPPADAPRRRAPGEITLRVCSPGLAGPCCSGASTPQAARMWPNSWFDVGLDAGADVERARVGVGSPAPQVGAHHVADEDVVARLLAVAVDRRLLAAQQLHREDRDHAGLAVRVLARAVDVARSAARRTSRPYIGAVAVEVAARSPAC